MKVYRREHYLQNRDRLIAENTSRSRDEKTRNIEALRDYLAEHPCVDCGTTDIRVLEFDHRPDEIKVIDISRAISAWKWDSVLAEVAKCDVRCRNCHAIITQTRGGHFRASW